MVANLRARRGVVFYLQSLFILSALLLVGSGCGSKEVVVADSSTTGESSATATGQQDNYSSQDLASIYAFIDTQSNQAQYMKIQPLIQKAEQSQPQSRVAEDYLLLAVQKREARDFASVLAMAQAGLDLKPTDRTLKGHLFYMRGVGQAQSGNFKKAKGSFQNAMLVIPDYEPAILQTGLIYQIHDKNMKQAKTYFEMGLRRNPHRIEYYSHLGSIYEAEGNWGKTEEMYLKVLKRDPTSAVALNTLGTIYLAQERFDEAETMLGHSALAGDPSVQYQLGILYTTAKPNAAKAQTHLAKAVQLEPGNADYHMALAQAYKTSNPAKAKEHLDAVLKLNPNASSYIQVAQWHRNTKAYKESMAYLEQALQLEPNNPEVTLEKGLLLIDQKKINDAKIEFEKVAKLNPKNVRAPYYLGLIDMISKDPKDPEKPMDPKLEEPRQWAQKILANPSDPEPHYQLGMYYLKARNFDNVLIEAENLQRLDPKLDRGHWLLADMYLTKREFVPAERELNWMIANHPRHEKTQQVADAYFENTIKIKEWEEYYRELYSSKKDALNLNYALMKIYRSTEDDARLLKTLETVVGQETNRAKNDENYTELADLYVDKGDIPYAQMTIKRALIANADSKVLKAKLAELRKPQEAPHYMEGIPSQYTRSMIVPSSKGWTKLHFAAAKGNMSKVKRLIGRGAAIDPLNGKGLTPLHEAVKRDQLEVVKFLLENGANIHAAVPQDQFQAIHIAANYRRLEVLEYLISKGANLNAKTSEGETALIAVSQLEWHKENKVAKLLVKKGADIEAVNVFGCQALCYAAEKANMDLVKFLLDKGADINFTSAKGDTPLIMAIISEDSQLVEFMLEHGADATVEYKGSNLIKFAKKLNQKRIVGLLKRAQ